MKSAEEGKPVRLPPPTRPPSPGPDAPSPAPTAPAPVPPARAPRVRPGEGPAGPAGVCLRARRVRVPGALAGAQHRLGSGVPLVFPRSSPDFERAFLPIGVSSSPALSARSRPLLVQPRFESRR